MRPITTLLCNGDIIEILTSSNSKGPSRDWLKYVKTSGARSKIKSFFKSELKDENIKLGKSMLLQSIQDKGFTFSQLLTEEYLQEFLKTFNMEDIDEIYASIGSGSMTAGQVASKLIRIYNDKHFTLPKQDNINKII